MSSTLVINNDTAWMPQARAFERVLHYTATELSDRVMQLTNFLLNRDETYFLDFTHLNAEEFNAVLRAIEKAFDRTVTMSNQELSLNSAYFPWFLVVFSQLKALMRYDPRIRKDEGEIGKLVISSKSVWVAPNPWYDMVLENVSAFASEPELSEILLGARIHRNGYGDISNISATKYGKFLEGVKTVHMRHATGTGPGMKAFDFFEALAPYVIDLYEKARYDRRTPPSHIPGDADPDA